MLTWLLESTIVQWITRLHSNRTQYQSSKGYHAGNYKVWRGCIYCVKRSQYETRGYVNDWSTIPCSQVGEYLHDPITMSTLADHGELRSYDYSSQYSIWINIRQKKLITLLTRNMRLELVTWDRWGLSYLRIEFSRNCNWGDLMPPVCKYTKQSVSASDCSVRRRRFVLWMMFSLTFIFKLITQL